MSINISLNLFQSDDCAVCVSNGWRKEPFLDNFWITPKVYSNFRSDILQFAKKKKNIPIREYDCFSILGTSLLFLSPPLRWCIWRRLGDQICPTCMKFFFSSSGSIISPSKFIARQYYPAQFLTKFSYSTLYSIKYISSCSFRCWKERMQVLSGEIIYRTYVSFCVSCIFIRTLHWR